MRLLFDANLSPRLVGRVSDLFPESLHVFDTVLARDTPDQVIWNFAAAHELTIVTADADFLDPARFRGAPPRVVRLENCDYRTREVEMLLRRHAVANAGMKESARLVIPRRLWR